MDAPNRSDWKRQLGSAALTIGIVAVLVALQTIHEFQADLGRDSVGLYFSEALYLFLPIGAALLAGQLARLDVRALAVATAIITLVMVGQDFLPPSEITAYKRGFVYGETADDWDLRDQGDVIRWAEGGALPVVTGYLTGRIDEINVDALPVAEGARSVQVAWSLFKVGYLLAPFIAVGFVVALRTWIARNLRFRTRGSERVFHVAVSWIVGPLVPLFLLQVNDLAVFWAFAQFGLPVILLPPVAFAVAAALGWRAGIRAERRAAYLDASPVQD